MPYLIGTDEAGYGPNLGPLVVTATVWRTAANVAPESLYELLSDCVCSSPSSRDDQRVAIADSKQLYQPAAGLGLLERGVAAALDVCGVPAATWRELWMSIAGCDAQPIDFEPWHVGYDHALPVACSRDEIERSADRLRAGLALAGLELVAIRCAVIFPSEFNQQVDRLGNKSSLLTQCTLELIRKSIDSCRDGHVVVSCDKHGGRNRYAVPLQAVFPEYLVEVWRESRESSIYRWCAADQRVEFQFVVNAERLVTAALASMVSKYVRELAMRAFNAYWIREIPGLRPTAGYPTDAQRFKKEIVAKQQSLGISDDVLWRCR